MRAVALMVSAVALMAQTAGKPQAFTGVVSDSMCKADHKHMGITPDARCVRECVEKHNSKYVLMVGEKAFILSDQQTPAKFAAEKVTVRGVLYAKTGIIKVESISRAK